MHQLLTQTRVSFDHTNSDKASVRINTTGQCLSGLSHPHRECRGIRSAHEPREQNPSRQPAETLAAFSGSPRAPALACGHVSSSVLSPYRHCLRASQTVFHFKLFMNKCIHLLWFFWALHICFCFFTYLVVQHFKFLF